jgi:hypothetical protein
MLVADRRLLAAPARVVGQFFLANWSILAGVTSWKGM